ncbi:hypothetical protein [Oligoflexus tunisiensis]|uniref:hypothetical protein n=1 Tax=Oligoflexus tunisiensis TaxID=708132 RepID=UPI00114C96F4|nr:hypothetical protein [Oligoflexus tunisiensis]
MVKKSEAKAVQAAEKLIESMKKPRKVKTGIYIDIDLRDDLQALAEASGGSFNGLVEAILKDWVSRNR